MRRRVRPDHRRRPARPAQTTGQPVRLRGGRHRQQQQIGTQRLAHVDREGQRQVRVELAFVALVEEYRTDPGQVRVALQPGDEQPGGHHLHPGRRTAAAVTTYRVADRPADLDADESGHPAGGGPRGHPPRFGHHNPTRDPAGHGERNERRLTRTGRRDQDRRPTRSHRNQYRRQDRPHRQIHAGRQVRIGEHADSLPHPQATATTLRVGIPYSTPGCPAATDGVGISACRMGAVDRR